MAKRNDSKLAVTEIHVKDVLGVRQRSIEPGRITTLTGRNGSGKTSPVESIKAALGGGNLAKLARVDPAGAEVEPEVVLVLEGPGSESFRVEKAGNKTARVRARVGDTQAFEDVPRPQAWLESLFDREASNPLTYLNAKDTERARLLLEALPLEMDRAELEHLLGLDSKHVPMLPTGLHPLKELELISDSIYRARTGVNVNARGKADAADQTRRKLPATIPDEPAAEIASREKAAQDLTAAVAREESESAATETQDVASAEAAYRLEDERIRGEFKVEAAKRRKAHDDKAAELRAAVERQIAELKAETGHVVEALNGSAVEQIDAAEKAKDEAVATAKRARESARFNTEARRRDLNAQREQLAGLRMMAQESAAARALQQQAEQFEREAEELKTEGARMTATLEALAALGRRLSDNLPIAGLAIEGDSIKVNGILFEQLNLGQRIEIACKVACLRAREQRLPVLFVDGAESLDSEHLAALKDYLLREGVQAFVARVEDHDLEIETVGEAVTA